MIAVIADDLTGAAELGGIGLRYDLSVEIAMDVNSSSKADLLIIATDTRSKPQEEAVSEIVRVTSELIKLNPQIIFKKVDSVLRGHIVPEIKAQLEVLNLKKAILVPANPALGRTIVDGSYYINAELIARTGFSKDPEFPAEDSDVLKMLKVDKGSILVQKHQQPIPENGIIVGEAAETEDLKDWVSGIDSQTLMAGGSGLFLALLDSLKISAALNVKSKSTERSNKLFISGTAFNKSAAMVKGVYCAGGPVSYMPRTVCSSEELSEDDLRVWAAEIIQLISQKGKAVIAIDSQAGKEPGLNALQLRERTALVVRKVFQETDIGELIIEGGSTASAILRHLELKTLIPVEELAPGVIRSRSSTRANLHVMLKPGSYEWPAAIWQF